MSARRVLRVGRLYFDGMDDYAVVGLQPDGSGKPFTVYGWSEITITEWIYAIRPKANRAWSKTSMIGDTWIDYPATFNGTDSFYDYTILLSAWRVRRPDGTYFEYSYNLISEVNRWVFLVRRFTSNREYSVWVNGIKKYAVTVPSEYKTVLEWNPDNATYPGRYKRFVLGANARFAEWMTCMYGEVRIYNRALSDGEIKAIYERDELIKDGLVLCLDFSEYEGNIAYDKSGYGNHGYLYGGARWVIKKALAR